MIGVEKEADFHHGIFQFGIYSIEEDKIIFEKTTYLVRSERRFKG